MNRREPKWQKAVSRRSILLGTTAVLAVATLKSSSARLKSQLSRAQNGPGKKRGLALQELKSLFAPSVILPVGFTVQLKIDESSGHGPSGYFRYDPSITRRLSDPDRHFIDDHGRDFIQTTPRFESESGIERAMNSKVNVIPIIQSALDAAGPRATADSPIAIVLPAGELFFDVNAPNCANGIHLRNSNVWLVGAGPDKTVIKLPAGCEKKRAIHVGDPDYHEIRNRAVPNNIRIQDFTIDLNNATAFVTGIALRKPANGIVIENIRGIQSSIANGAHPNHRNDSWLCNFECYQLDINRNVVLIDVESYDKMQLHAGGGRGLINFYNIRPMSFSGLANGMTITNVGTEGRFENINFIEPYVRGQQSRAIWIGPDDSRKRPHDLTTVSRPCFMRGLRIVRATVGRADDAYQFSSGIWISPFLGGLYDVEIQTAAIHDDQQSHMGVHISDFDYNWRSISHGGLVPTIKADDVDLGRNVIIFRDHKLCTGTMVVLHRTSSNDRLPAPINEGLPYFIKVIDKDSFELYGEIEKDMSLSEPIAFADRGEGLFDVKLSPYVTNLVCTGLDAQTARGVILNNLRLSQFDRCNFGRLDIARLARTEILNSRCDLLNIGNDLGMSLRGVTLSAKARHNYRAGVAVVHTKGQTTVNVTFKFCLFERDGRATNAEGKPSPRYAVYCNDQPGDISLQFDCCDARAFNPEPWAISPQVKIQFRPCSP